MDHKIAGGLSAVGSVIILAIWFVFLFSAQPSGHDSTSAAIDSAIQALNPRTPGSWFFISLLVSAFICMLCAALLFMSKHTKLVMVLVVFHSVAAVFIYTWSLAVAIAMPLLFFRKLVKNA